MASYGFHANEWVRDMYSQLQNWDCGGFVETEFITPQGILEHINRGATWLPKNKLEASAVFPPALVAKFENDTADEFVEWFEKYRRKN